MSADSPSTVFGDTLLRRFLDAWARTRSISYRLRKVERLRNGEVVREAVTVKLRKPLAVYVAALEPRRGQEVIYDVRVDPNELVVHPGRFPDLTLHLDIHGSLATNRQHHTIAHSGFDYLIWALGLGYSSNRVVQTTQGTLARRPVLRLLLEPERVGTRKVRAKSGESLFQFAERVGMDAYYIYYHNPQIDELTDALDNEPYLVPLTYGAKTEVALDAESFIPVQITVWDDAGRLYEQLVWTEVVLNPPLSDATFDPDNPAYNF